VSTLAGSGKFEFSDGTGVAASFYGPAAIAIDNAGILHVADQLNQRIRKVTTSGEVTTLAGSGSAGWVDGQGAAASFNQPWGIAIDGAGNVFVGDVSNNRIRKVTGAGMVSTLAGSGSAAWADGEGMAASFDIPNGVAVDGAGNVYVADNNNHRIRKVTSDGRVTTLAGSVRGYADGAAAQFSHPSGIALGSGNLYVSETLNNRIRKVTEVGRGQLVVSWLAPSGRAITSYTSYTASASADGRPTQTCVTMSTSCIVSGLASSVAYTVIVTATSSTGTSIPSAAVIATPN
jgi:hypothetical protein